MGHNRRVPILGAHVDSSGGLHLAFGRAAEMGAVSIQCHPTPPGFWGSPKLDEERISKFREAADAAGNPPFFFHAVYLINLAGDDATLRQRSESTLAGYLAAADQLGITGVIFHTGSHKGAGFEKVLPQVREHLLRVKGILNLKDHDRPVAIHVVRHLMHPPVKLSAWPAGDPRTSRMVFITRDLPRAVIEDGLRAFQAAPE